MTRLGLPPWIQLALACAYLSACGGAQPSEAFVVRDSAGVRIVQTLWPDGADLPTCAVATTPALDIGVVQGDPVYQLYRVFDALQLSDGRIAVVNQGSSELRFYDAEGRYTGAVGREGEGPGEFRGVRAAWEDGDSLLVWDDELQRFSVFGPDGDFERSFRMVPRLMNEPDVLGPVATSIHVAYHHVVIEPPGFAPQTLYHIRYDRTGNVVDTLSAYPYGTYGPIGRPEDYMAGRTLFEARTAMAASDDHVFVATGNAPEVVALDADGRVVEIVRWSDEDRTVRPQDIDRYREERLARSENPEWRRAVLLSVDEVPVSERFPAVADLRVDDADRIWVQRYPRPGAGPEREWLVFGRDRRFLCRATIQAGFAITRIQGDRLIGRVQDDADVEYIQVRGFSLPSARSTPGN